MALVVVSRSVLREPESLATNLGSQEDRGGPAQGKDGMGAHPTAEHLHMGHNEDENSNPKEQGEGVHL
jgi:hypothetical protein